MNGYDVIIIGGGAAGLSAALVLGRARRRVLVVDAGHPRNAAAAHMQGYLSRDGMPPAHLLETGRREIEGYGAQIRQGTVRELIACGRGANGSGNGRGSGSGSGNRFQVLLEDGDRLAARRVLVTTGLSDELPDVPGLRERWGRDVLHCPYCHGWEVRDRQLGVLWNGPQTVQYAQIVRQWSHDVVLFAPVDTLTQLERTQLVARAIGIVEGPVARVVVIDDRLTGVEGDDGRIVVRDAVFVPPTFVPHSDLLAPLGCQLDVHGWVVTGENGATSVPGLRVAGNVANPRAQVITAAGEGSAAAIAVNAELVEDDVRAAVHSFHLGLTP